MLLPNAFATFKVAEAISSSVPELDWYLYLHKPGKPRMVGMLHVRDANVMQAKFEIDLIDGRCLKLRSDAALFVFIAAHRAKSIYISVGRLGRQQASDEIRRSLALLAAFAKP